MRFIFIDEVEQQQKRAGFFGVGGLAVSTSHYATLQDGVDEALDDAGWNRDEEFKGRFIFSSSKGDKSVPIEKRIELVKAIVATTTAKENARARFSFAHNLDGKTADNYLGLVGKVVARCPKPENQKRDKPLVSVYLDHSDIVKPAKVAEKVRPILEERELRLVENPVLLISSNGTAGLIAADVLTYLKSWDVLFPEPSEAQQAELFETPSDKLNAEKLSKIREILSLVKQVEVISED
jgi:hypothetical protein